MIQLDFSTNPNGKLFCDIFHEIRINSQALATGVKCEIMHKGMFLGYAEILAVKNFQFSRLDDSDAYVNCGFPAPYQAALLNRYYNAGRLLPSDTIFSKLTLNYITRNMEATNILLKDYWNYKNKLYATNNC